MKCLRAALIAVAFAVVSIGFGAASAIDKNSEQGAHFAKDAATADSFWMPR